MGFFASLGLIFVGLFIGQIIPRVPQIILTRMKSVNQQFPEHPRAIPVDAHLIARVLHLQLARRLGVLFTSFPIGFGIMPQIRQAMIHLDCYTEEELNGINEQELLQMWVNAILDNQIDNDWERLGEIGERP